MQPPNHAWRFEGILKTKSQASEVLHPESLQSKIPTASKIESSIKLLDVLHRRPIILKLWRYKSWPSADHFSVGEPELTFEEKSRLLEIVED